jgi:hypothetical protein
LENCSAGVGAALGFLVLDFVLAAALGKCFFMACFFQGVYGIGIFEGGIVVFKSQ